MVDLVGDRDKFADKKSFGHSLVLGGSHGLTGAISLASNASVKAGPDTHLTRPPIDSEEDSAGPASAKQ